MKKALKYIGVAALSAVLITGGTYGYFMITGSIFPGVRLEDNSLGFQTRREVAASIDAYKETLADKTITVLSDKTKTTLYLENITEMTATEDIVQEAFSYGRSGTFSERISEIADIITKGKQISFVTDVKEDALRELLKEFVEKSYISPKARTYVLKDGALLIDGGEEGKQVDIDKAIAEISERIHNNDWSNYTVPYLPVDAPNINLEEAQKSIQTEPIDPHYDAELKCIVPGEPGITFDLEQAKQTIDLSSTEIQSIPLTYIEPKITVEEMEKKLFKDTLGSFTTYYGGASARATNIQLAAQSIDDYILQPGEVFSFNNTCGETTLEKGYQESVAFVNGKPTADVGGGVCQVSSTLYVATLYADMDVVERQNHSLPVGYMDPAWDATVYTGVVDFKFKNTSPFPVKIDTIAEGGALTIKIIGTKTEDKTISLSSKVTKTENGYRYAELYKTTTANGESNTIRENLSRYKIG